MWVMYGFPDNFIATNILQLGYGNVKGHFWTHSISHIAYNCPQYEHLKGGKNIENSEADLCQFFTEVIQLRDETQPSGVF